MTERAELRLALVCYGGVSLAVYMHGVTKELHKLVIASRAFDAANNDPDSPNPFDPPTAEFARLEPDTEKIYYDALAALARRDRDGREGRPLSVAIDIIGGTSAGGINGVVLAKALALNASQTALRDLWISEAQITKLLNAPEFFGVNVQMVLATLRSVLHLNKSESLLKSDVMSQLLLDALRDMDADHDGAPTLVPDGGSLELFVTTTDLRGYEVTVPTGCGGRMQRDRGFAQVMQFNSGAESGADGFGGRNTYSLAFAARATSAFPAAFARVSVAGFAEEIAKGDNADRDEDTRALDVVPPSIFRFNYAENGRDVEDSYFVDGGLMDNAPFDLVIEAIARRPAEHEVIRRLIYIEPDPDKRLDDDEHRNREHRDGDNRDDEPSLLDIKDPLTAHPFLNDLIKLRDMNARIERIGAISDQQMAEIVTQIDQQGFFAKKAAEQAVPGDQDGTTKAQEAATKIASSMQEAAESDMRPTWNTYQRMKATSVAERIAKAINRVTKMPPQSSTATFVTSVLAEWLEQQHFWEVGDSGKLINAHDPSTTPPPADITYRDEASISDFLRPRDTPYRERRLLYILAGINKLYRPDGPPAASLDTLKREAWRQLSETQTAPEKVVAQLQNQIAFLAPEALDDTVFESPVDFANRHRDDLTTLFADYARLLAESLGDGSQSLWDAFSNALKQSENELGRPWPEADTVAIFLRYLGFPRWDALMYPVISLSQLPQFTPIPVSQFSPIEATALDLIPNDPRDRDDEPKLYGKGLHHFQAFMDPSFRRSDYLWGRLDAAELIIRMLNETVQTPSFDLATTLVGAFTAITQTEGTEGLPENSRNTSLLKRIEAVPERIKYEREHDRRR